MSPFTARPMFQSSRLLLVLERAGKGRGDLPELLATAATEVDELLLKHGALLFRGFNVKDVAAFEAFLDAIPVRRASYVYRSTPRTAVGDRVYTATEYPASQEIPLHSENAYQRSWPLKVAFCCVTASDRGGATPLADVREVTRAIGERLLHKFASRGVEYIRHYRPYVDIPWQAVFQTEDRCEVELYCERNGLEYEWVEADTLRTSQVSHGAAAHPITRELLFFNQAHLFHVSSLGAANAELLIRTYGRDRLPRNARYGDGTEIPDAELETVRDSFRRQAVVFSWQPGDVLLLDNMQVAHGRQPFSGPRRILTALLDPNVSMAASR